MIKLSDYIANRLVEYGVSDVFMITGGGAMHLNDSLGNHPKLNYICNHHEQASAIAAEGYSRVSGKLAVVNVTTGPGGLNTLTGVLGQWTDSVPVLYISGQVKKSTTIQAYPDLPLRQIGDQEVDIISVVKPITKFAEQITKPNKIKHLIDKAIHIATSGRPGPVWIDIPMDIQAAIIDEAFLEEYYPSIVEANLDFDNIINNITDVIKHAKRPLIIAGNGIKIANAKTDFLNLIEKLNIPVVTTFNGMDIMHNEHPLYVGRIGTLGNRGGNFSLQNADVVISIGSRSNIRQVSYNWEYFVREGKLILVDIDQAELDKPTVNPFIKVCADAKIFINKLQQNKDLLVSNNNNEWIKWCKERLLKYPTVLHEYKEDNDGLHPYYFIEKLSQALPDNATVIAGNGTACVGVFQAAEVKKGQNYFWNSGCASMGYDLPASIGASIALNNTPVYCLAGDGSLMMNIQELATLAQLRLPVKLIILDNGGYIN